MKFSVWLKFSNNSLKTKEEGKKEKEKEKKGGVGWGEGITEKKRKWAQS